jgi:hypothetical protein
MPFPYRPLSAEIQAQKPISVPLIQRSEDWAGRSAFALAPRFAHRPVPANNLIHPTRTASHALDSVVGVGGGVIPLLLANFSDALASLVLGVGNESVP